MSIIYTTLLLVHYDNNHKTSDQSIPPTVLSFSLQKADSQKSTNQVVVSIWFALPVCMISQVTACTFP